GDELEPFGPGDRQPRRVAVDADEDALAEIDLVAADAHPPGALHDDVDLLLPVVGVVVLAPLGARRERDGVEPDRLRAERAAYLPHRPARPFARQVCDVDRAVAHRASSDS